MEAGCTEMEACNLFQAIRVGSRTCGASQGRSGGPSIKVDPRAAKSKMIVGVLVLSSKRLALLRWLKSQLVTLVTRSGDDCRYLRLCHETTWTCCGTRRHVDMPPCVLRHIPWIEMSLRLRFFS
jgi:hypothetical protein